jgi:hypothetical protein
MFRRRLLEFALPFPPDCLVHDWWLAVVSVSSKAGGICLVNEPLTAYRQHSSNVIGAKAETTLKISAIIARIKAPPRGISILEKRINVYKLHIARLDGYLQRDIWSKTERLVIKKMKCFVEGYLTDAHDNLWRRILKPRHNNFNDMAVQVKRHLMLAMSNKHLKKMRFTQAYCVEIYKKLILC